MVFVFSRGRWLNIPLPRSPDRSWSQDSIHIYGTAVEAFRQKGFSELRANQLGEAYVYKQLHPDLIYDQALETELALLETA